MSSSTDQNPPLQQNSQNQPTNASTLQINQVRENFRNNNRNNHVQGYINSKRKQQQMALQIQKVRIDFNGLLDILKQSPTIDNFQELSKFYGDENDRAIRISYMISVQEYISSLENYDPEILEFLIPFLLKSEQFNANHDFVRALLNIISNQQCYHLHEDCLIIIQITLKTNPEFVHEMQEKEEDFKKIFNPNYSQCTFLRIRIIILICQILQSNNVKYVLSDKESSIKTIFLRCVDYGDPESIYLGQFLLDCLEPEQRSAILRGCASELVESYKTYPLEIELYPDQAFKSLLYGANNTIDHIQRFYIHAMFEFLDSLRKLKLAIKFLKLLWPTIYNIERDFEKHYFVIIYSYFIQSQ
ncbi:hypothetical protein pb186bvf_018142 [Paramecium bursaria]